MDIEQMLITPFYAAVLALVFVVLSVRTIRLRRRLQIGVGDAGNVEMLRAMRVHANFAEYVPLTLLLIFMMETAGAYTWLVHVLCLCLIVGRVAHAYGVREVAEDYRYRIFGMVMTFTTLVSSALILLVLYGRQAVV